MELTAHYSNNGILLIVRGPSPTPERVVSRAKVSGKREARKVAIEAGAKPWNF